ncbi:hypothetical protein GCM10022197_13490 [Microlunatus spumicola]|uniref:Bacterial Ig-like domain-containing protein n=1 Tax=Microlunatus spumicola TaxID=81499 RepID=A0ABP6X2H9_9ACTN
MTFTSTGAVQTFTVPTGVTALTAAVAGAAGGGSTTTPGGLGGRTSGTLAVDAGDELSLVVGGAGTYDADSGAGGAGGFGGGGAGGSFTEPSGGAGGGGGSFLFDDDTLLLAAGGGGGGTAGSKGGAGGAAGEAAGAGASSIGDGGDGGEPGTLDMNGAGGFVGGDGGDGEATSATELPVGGQGADGSEPEVLDALQPGAGGGGGFHAGGGGGTGGSIPTASGTALPGGGGGGGAGFAEEAVTDVVGAAGVQSGAGVITLSYTAGLPPASITFTSSLDGAVVGKKRNVSAEGSGSARVVFSADPTTTNGACTVDGASVTFAHVGTCVVRADQAADEFHSAGSNQLSFAIGQGNQTLTFNPLPPTGSIGDTVDLVATSDAASGSPVELSLGAANTEGACTINGTKLTLTGVGTCSVLASQAATVDYKAAISVDHRIAVTLVATSTTLAFDLETPVFGQPVNATATVTGAEAGTVQLSVDGQPVGEPVVLVDGKAGFTLPAGLTAGGHPIEAVFTPADAATYGSSTGTATLAVGKAMTRSALTVRADEASVVVSAVEPGAGTPEGTVRFTVGDGTPSAPVTLVRGKATFSGSVPADTDVRVAYSGDDDFAASSDSTLRKNPTIEASVSSEFPKSPAGWYRSAVKVSFTCDEGSAPLVGGCPADVTLSDDGASQGVTKTVVAADGGIATASVTGINIDRTRPEVMAFGVEEGARFFSTAPEAGCVAQDELSGVGLCAATRKVKDKAVTYSVAAVDQAGNVTTEVVHATTYNRGIVDVPYEDGAYTVTPGQSVTLVAKSSKRPQVYKPVEVPKKPSKSGDKFKATDVDDEWALGYTIPTNLKPGTTYNLGIKTTSRYTIKIRVVA